MARSVMPPGAVLATLCALVGCGEAGDGGDTDATSSASSVGEAATQTGNGTATTSDDGSSSSTATTSSPSSTTASASSGEQESSTGAESEDASSTGVSEEEGVLAFVSIAHGGQTARSCDGGQTWHAFHDFGIQDDHSDYAAFGGITFGNGAFVAATGWGADAHVLYSTDGVTWDDRPDDAFVSVDKRGRPNSSSGVEFNGEAFVLFAGGAMWWSPDGLTWTEDTPATLEFAGHFREVEYLEEAGLLLIAMETDDPEPWRVHLSDDGGRTWEWGTGVTTDCGGYIQHAGGFASHAGRLLLAGGGRACISEDGGLSWSMAGDPGVGIADLESTDDGFVVLGAQGEILQSTDGVTWSGLGASGLSEGRIGWARDQGFVGADVGYVHSQSGTRWSSSGSTVPEGFGGIREFAVGRVQPDADCPR